MEVQGEREEVVEAEGEISKGRERKRESTEEMLRAVSSELASGPPSL